MRLDIIMVKIIMIRNLKGNKSRKEDRRKKKWQK